MRDLIVSEIRRIASANGGRAPGSVAFENATGIIPSKWLGKYWARWSDALFEAGFQPNQWNGKSDRQSIFSSLIFACRTYGHFPTNSELDLLRNSNPEILSTSAIKRNLGPRSDVFAGILQYIGSKPEYADVAAMLPAVLPLRTRAVVGAKPIDGHVYLIKSGEFYKIGRSDELERRVKEIRVALPDAATLVHSITTDDPSGIETYWHRRFVDRRANGEWFKLARADVKAFLRRKFQ